MTLIISIALLPFRILGASLRILANAIGFAFILALVLAVDIAHIPFERRKREPIKP